MVQENLIENVDIEKLYSHILKIEGVKHAIDTPEKLNEVADYIKDEFRSYGIEAAEQKFTIEDFDFTFRNIEAVIGEGDEPELLITSHYDTVPNAPGANDNGTGIAAMLEIARILSKEKLKMKIRFVSFTLEELNPANQLNARSKAQELGLTDETHRYQTYHTFKIMKKYSRLFYKQIAKGHSRKEAGEIAINTLEKQLTPEEREYFESRVKYYQTSESQLDWLGKLMVIGSKRWLEKALEEKKQIKGIINLETIGYTSKRKHAQRFPSFLFKLFPRYKVNIRKGFGNFIAIVGSKNSKDIVRIFRKKCKEKNIQLPYVAIRPPLEFNTIVKLARDLLRSDHAPFWQVGIPSIMLTDTAEFRYPYYHTHADTIDKLDFDFMTKVCKATILTIMELEKIFQ